MLCVWSFSSIFGMVVEVKQMSAKDSLERKKYMGVWRWESETMARMMGRFPVNVIKYMDRNSPKRRGCRSGSSVNPRRRKFLTPVWFPLSMSLLGLPTRRKKSNTKFTLNKYSPE